MNLLEKLKEINKERNLSNQTVLKIVCKNGIEMKGYYQAYVSELDNEPEEAELDIVTTDIGASVGLLESEIKSIEVITD